MIEIKGGSSTAIVYTDDLEEKAYKQIQTLCNMEFTEGSNIRIMPDVHAGAGCTIGTTMHIKDKAVPNLVGVDIGCGMETVCLRETVLDLGYLDQVIHQKIPSGYNIRLTPHGFLDKINITNLCCKEHVSINRAMRSIGTLGGGNHFIEVNRDEEGNLYLIVHSGSRHLGLEVANYYQRAGYDHINSRGKREIQNLIETYKKEGREKELHKAIQERKKQVITNIPYSLAFVSGSLFDDYIHDMKIVQQFAALNRQAMVYDIMKELQLTAVEQFTTIHNYIDTEAMVLRKGAVSAQKGEKLLIPINMRDGSLICIGKGNPDWNCSAPHGAGRLMSRTQAKKSFTLEEYQKQMEGIYTTSISYNTLDECPMAYKPIEEIVKQIGPTVDIIKQIKPVYNFKAPD